jgi:hypothetical protein
LFLFGAGGKGCRGMRRNSSSNTKIIDRSRHCEERSDEAIQGCRKTGLLRGACHPAALCADRVARNDGMGVLIS